MKITPRRRPGVLTLVGWTVNGIAFLFRLFIYCGLIVVILLTVRFLAKLIMLFWPLIRHAIGGF
ncbi:hypothetical protein ACFL5Z_09610 [Planctomycetota bacterium]